MQKWKKFRFKQNGAALILFVVLLVLAGSGFLLYLMDSSRIKAQREIKTYSSLSEAKAALIGYSIMQLSKPGTFPCTDSLNAGNVVTSGTNACAKYIGRLPWKQLGMPMLKDANGECLWYALSPTFRNQMTIATRKLNPLNSSTNGTIKIVDSSDTAIASANSVIAVVIAPNNPVSGQNRSGIATTYCPGDSIASKYLDTNGTVNNATGNVVGVNYTFKKAASNNTFNDQIVYITAKELFPLLRKRIAKEIVGDPSPLAVPSGLVKYYQTTSSKYPCPSKTVTGNANCTLPLGANVPYKDAVKPLQYTALGSWLEDNGWFAMTTYSYFSSTHIKVTVIDALGSYACDANMNVVTCG